MTSSHPDLSPEDQEAIDAELHPFNGATLPIVRPSSISPSLAPESALICSSEGKEQESELPSTLDIQVSFSPPPGAFNGTSLSLELKCEVPHTRIFYALGTNSVDDNGLVYNSQNSILLTQTTLVAARAERDGQLGPIQQGRFEINKPRWQELEPKDQNDPTPHKLSEVSETQDRWRVAAGSVRGKLHAHRGSWREDAFALTNVETEGGAWSVSIVSDGAGSAPLSRVGSNTACAAAKSSLQVSLKELATLSNEQGQLVSHDLPRLRQAIVQAGLDALKAVEEQAETRDKPLTAFAATLLILVRREWNGCQLYAALQVGDGSIALWDGKAVTILGEADHGQNSGETRFLTTIGIENELAARVKFSIKNHLEAFAVMSDGVSDDFYPENTQLEELFTAALPLTQNAEDGGAAVVSWLGYEKRGSSDDRTLIIGWPHKQASSEEKCGG